MSVHLDEEGKGCYRLEGGGRAAKKRKQILITTGGGYAEIAGRGRTRWG